MDDVTTERRFDSQAMRDIDVLNLFFDVLSMGVCKTRHWQTSGRLVQNLDACTECALDPRMTRLMQHQM